MDEIVFFFIYPRTQCWIPSECERDDEWDSASFWEDVWLWMSNTKKLSSRLQFTSKHCNWPEMKHLFFPQIVTQAPLRYWTEGSHLRHLYTYVHAHFWKLIDSRLVQGCGLIEYDGWILYQRTAANRLWKCRFGFSAIFSRYPAAESRSQEPRDNRTLRSQRLWSDILMLLSLNHWDVPRRTHRYSKGELSFMFIQDIWDRKHQIICFYCLGYVHLD